MPIALAEDESVPVVAGCRNERVIARAAVKGVAVAAGADPHLVAGTPDERVVGAVDAEPVVAVATEELVLFAGDIELLSAVVAEGGVEVATALMVSLPPSPWIRSRPVPLSKSAPAVPLITRRW